MKKRAQLDYEVNVRYLAHALDVRYAFVAEFAGVKTRVRTLAFWSGDRFIDNFEYDLAGTPCEAVLAGEMCLYKQRVQALFPRDSGLAEIRAESYLAVPLMDIHDNVMGHLAMIDTKPMAAVPRDLSVFRIFAARVRAELEHRQAEEALRRSEERLTGILTSAMDAIITIDGERRVTLFNQAAERVFGCAAAWAIGQPFDRFLSKRFRSLLEGLIRQLEDGQKSQQLWAPDGLTALRANREEFPIEATISPLKVAGLKLYTIILRDVNERKRAEAEIERLQLEKHYLQEAMGLEYSPLNLIGSSPAMKRLIQAMEQVAASASGLMLSHRPRSSALSITAGRETSANCKTSLSGLPSSREDPSPRSKICQACPCLRDRRLWPRGPWRRLSTNIFCVYWKRPTG